MNAVGYLRIGVGTGMVAGSSVSRDCPASQERFENEWRPPEPCSSARTYKAREELPGPSEPGYRRPSRDPPSLRRNNKHLIRGDRQRPKTSPQSKAVLTQMPLLDRRGTPIVHVYRVRLLHQLRPTAGARLVSQGSEQAGVDIRSRTRLHAFHHLGFDAVLLLVIEQKLLGAMTKNKQSRPVRAEPGRHTSLALDGPQLLPDQSGRRIDLSGGLNA